MKSFPGIVLALLFFPIILPAQALTAQLEAKGDVTCFGLDDGYATIDAMGGTGPYTYELDSSGIALANNTINQLSPGIHHVRVRDVNYNFTDLTFEILEPSPLKITVADKKNVTCYGDHDGEVLLAANGGTGTYQFAIEQNSFSSSPSFKSLSAGPYIFSVKDENECLDDSTVFVSSTLAVNTFVTEKKDLACHGDSNGRIVMETFGGWGAYQYSLDSVNYQSQPSFSNLEGGLYSVFTVDSAGCRDKFEVRIDEPDSLIQELLKVDVSCFGMKDGRISLEGRGGTAPYAFSIDGTAFSFQGEFVSLVPGQYNVKTKDINGCETANQFIEIIEPPRLELTASVTDVRCKGESTGEVDLDVQGGTAPYLITWNEQEELDSTVLTGLGAGSYYAIVEDQNGCNETAFITIGEPDSALNLYEVEVEPTYCGRANGRVLLGLRSSADPVAFTWSHDPVLQGTLATNLLAGRYEISVEDALGCVANLVVDVPEGRRVLANFQTFPELNSSSFTAGQGEITFLNASKGASRYEWDFGDGIGFSVEKNPRYTYTEPGEYQIQLRATDDQGICSDTIIRSILVKADEWVKLPDAFTPNGDGVNDLFLPVGSGVQSFEMTFFDKWGRKLKETNALQDAWDGLDKKGKTVLPGVYAYKMRVVFDSGFVLERAGGVILLR